MKALVLGVAVLVCGAVAQADISTGLVSYWPFDGAVTDVYGGQATTHTGGTEDYATGKFGLGIDLDGGAEQIEVTETGAYAFGAAGNGFTISVWTKVTSFDTTWQALIAKGEGSEFRLHRSGNSNKIAFNAGSGGDATAGPDLNDGQFHHIVAVHRVGGTNNRVWVDGVKVFDGARGNVVDNNEPLMIGESPDALNREWEGVIDDVGIWGRPLTQGEIQWLWNGGEGKPIPEPASAVLAVLGLSLAAGLSRKVRRRRIA